MEAGAILVAAGSGSRAGSLKQFENLAGRPLFCWALRSLLASARVGPVAVVVPAGAEQRAAELAGPSDKPVSYVPGGERRQDSVCLGLESLPDCDWVVVHDAARPFLTSDLIERVLAGAAETGAATVGTPLADAVKRVDEGQKVIGTVSRDGLWAVQTPQAFRAELLRRAHGQVSADVPDDAAMVEQIGCEVRVVEGSRTNIKITSNEDFALAEALMTSFRHD